MNVILLSSLDGIGQPAVRHLSEAIRRQCGADKVASIAYVQYSSAADAYVEKARAFYERIGTRCRVMPVDLDQRFTAELLDQMMEADVLHLPGGNTFALMKAIRQRGISERITEFVRTGRLVVGVSAGALVLAPSIGTARFGDDEVDHDGDDRGLGVLGFEPFPHWNTHSHFARDLAGYSATCPHPIRIFNDDSAITVSQEGISILGSGCIMERGVMR